MTQKPNKQPDLSILTIRGYFNKHFRLCQSHKTQQDAYDALEEEYLELCNKHRYSTYDAFRVAKSRYYANSNNR